MCYAAGDFVLADANRLLGRIGGQPVCISQSRLFTDAEPESLEAQGRL